MSSIPLINFQKFSAISGGFFTRNPSKIPEKSCGIDSWWIFSGFFPTLIKIFFNEFSIFYTSTCWRVCCFSSVQLLCEYVYRMYDGPSDCEGWIYNWVRKDSRLSCVTYMPQVMFIAVPITYNHGITLTTEIFCDRWCIELLNQRSNTKPQFLHSPHPLACGEVSAVRPPVRGRRPLNNGFKQAFLGRLLHASDDGRLKLKRNGKVTSSSEKKKIIIIPLSSVCCSGICNTAFIIRSHVSYVRIRKLWA